MFSWKTLKLRSNFNNHIIRGSSGYLNTVHQTWHFLVGFILEPDGHLKSLANSGMLAKGPWTRNISGEWTPVRTRILSALGRYLAHQTLAALIQNNWRWPKDRPGRSFSSPLRVTHRSAKRNSKFTNLMLLMFKVPFLMSHYL